MVARENPQKSGTFTTFKVGSDAQSQPVQQFLANALGVSKRNVKVLLDERRVFVNNKRVWLAKFSLNAGDSVEVQGTAHPVAEQKIIEVLFESPTMLIVNKPSGLLSVGKASLEELLRKTGNEVDLWVAHRLDRDTTGCLLVARSRKVFEEIIEIFKKHQVQKEYRAIVRGTIRETEFVLDAAIDGRPARTEVRVLARNNFATEIAARPITGRLHQIRRHLADYGHPVVGDKQYEKGPLRSAQLRIVGRQMLHASEISLELPGESSGITTVKAPYPSDYLTLQKSLFR